MSEPEGHNSRKAVWLRHQAIAVLDKEKADALAKIRKKHRKNAELAGVQLGVLDWTLKTLELPVGEIRKFFTERLEALSFNGINVGTKVVEKIIGDMTEDRTYEGQLAGIAGKPASPPANLTPNERQTWLQGHAEGCKARDEAGAALDEEEAAFAEARANRVADASTEAAQELGGDGYGDGDAEGDGEGFEASEDELAAQTGRPSTQAAEVEEEPDTPAHQPAKRARKTAAVH